MIKIIENCCSLSTLSLLRQKCVESNSWHFRYPMGFPLEDKHAKLDIIDKTIKEEFLAGIAVSILTNVFDHGGSNFFFPEIFYCGVSIKDASRKDNVHTDEMDRPHAIKVLGILNHEWKEDWGGGFFYDDKVYHLRPGDFCIFDPKIPHSAEDIKTNTKRLAIDFSVRSINSQ